MITEKSVKLFHKTVENIPAYRNYLRSREFNPSSVTSIEDFSKIPITNKKDYLHMNARNELIWETHQTAPLWYCSTSGSTGEPYYFPRTDEIAGRGSYFAEAFLQYSSHGMGSTLVIIGFGMGVWIGGVITLRSFEIAAERTKLPVAFLPTGYNKQEVFKALKKLSPEFDQTILVGYPPFIKEIVDETESENIDLKKLKTRFIFAAEAFTESFRKYICKKAAVKNSLLDTLNIYGSADFGAMAYETPLSILIRRLALEDPLLYRDVFGQIEKTPTLAQYHPEFIEFEEINGELILTSEGAIPLIRYAIGDHGGVFSYEKIESLFNQYGVNLCAEVQKAGIGHTLSKRPFVFVYERTDLSASLHGIIIYPEFIKESLINKNSSKYFTQRFTMSTKFDINHNQFLQINLELQKDVVPSDTIEKLAITHITKSLKDKSSEFAEVSRSRSSDSLIQVMLWPNGHHRYFGKNTKQNWVKKA